LDPDAVSRALAVYIDEAGQQVPTIRQITVGYISFPHISSFPLKHLSRISRPRNSRPTRLLSHLSPISLSHISLPHLSHIAALTSHDDAGPRRARAVQRPSLPPRWRGGLEHHHHSPRERPLHHQQLRPRRRWRGWRRWYRGGVRTAPDAGAHPVDGCDCQVHEHVGGGLVHGGIDLGERVAADGRGRRAGVRTQPQRPQRDVILRVGRAARCPGDVRGPGPGCVCGQPHHRHRGGHPRRRAQRPVAAVLPPAGAGRGPDAGQPIEQPQQRRAGGVGPVCFGQRQCQWQRRRGGVVGGQGAASSSPRYSLPCPSRPSSCSHRVSVLLPTLSFTCHSMCVHATTAYPRRFGRGRTRR